MASLNQTLVRSAALLVAVPVVALALFGPDVRALAPAWAAARAAGWRVVDPEARAAMTRERERAAGRAASGDARPAAVEVRDWEYTDGKTSSPGF